MRFGPQIKIGSPKLTVHDPKITLSNKDRGGIIGLAAAGPMGGALGYMYGDKVGDWMQSSWEGLSGKTARENADRAAKAADRERRDSITKEMGARTQADALSLANSQNRNGGSSGAELPGAVGQSGAPGGVIGANITNSGTF